MWRKNKLIKLFLNPACVISVAAFVFLSVSDAQAVQIKRVQTGEVYFDADDISQVVTIQAVDQSKTIVLLNINSDVTTSNATQNTLFSALFGSNTDLMISRDGASYGVTVRYYVIEFAYGVTVQRGVSSFAPGSYTNPAYTTKDITLTSSLNDYTRAFAISQVRSALTNSTASEISTVTSTVLDNNTLRLQRVATNDALKSVNIVWQVVEFSADANVMTGTVNIADAALSNTGAISPAITAGKIDKCILLFSSRVGRSINGIEGLYKVRGTITNESTVTFTREAVTGTNIAIDIVWYIIELTDPTSKVQKNTVAVATAIKDVTLSLSPGIDTTRAFPIYSVSGPADSATSSFDDETQFSAQRDSPRGMAYDPVNNYIWVANYFSDTVTRYNAATGAQVGTPITVGTYPVALCYASTAVPAIWVANYGSQNVTKIRASDGVVLNTVAVGAANPLDIAYDSVTPAVWTVNYGSTSGTNGITKINATTDAASSANSTAGYPVAITYDPAGYMWVVFWNSRAMNRVVCSNSNVTSTNIFQNLTGYYGFSSICYAPAGFGNYANPTVWVTSMRNYYMARIDVTGGTPANRVEYGTELAPRGVTTVGTGAGGTIAFTNSGSNSILKMNPSDGTVLGTYATQINPWGIVYDATNSKIWVSNSSSGSIMKFNTDGTSPTVYSQGASCDKVYLSRLNSTTTLDVNIDWFVAEFCPITLTSPNGNELWRVGEVKDITWVHADSEINSTFDLLVSEDAGTTYPLTIATAVHPANDIYPWTIPPTLSASNLIQNDLRVRIIVTGTVIGDRRYDDSNANFEIKGSIAVTFPDSSVNASNPWVVGDTTRVISWDTKGNLNGVGLGTVKIELSMDNGSTWDTLAASVAAGDHNQSSSWPWNPVPNEVNVKNVIGGDNLIKVTHNSDSAVTSTSPAFYIKGKIYSVTPTTAVTWLLGETKTITWSKKGHFGAGVSDGTVDIYYSSNGGLSYNPTPIASGIAAGTDASGGTYDWAIPNDTVVSNPTSKIKVVQSSDATVYGESVDFYIKSSVTLDTPAGGEIWRFGESRDVKWTPHGDLGFVVIKYKIGAGAWNYLPGAAPADNLAAGAAEIQQTKSWLIANPLGANVTVRVAQNGFEDTVYDDCSSAINLKATINVSEPHLDELIKVTNATENNKKWINWSVNGSLSGTAHISLSKDGGATWPIVLTTGVVNINAGTYEWTVDAAHIDANKVKVSLDGDIDATTGTSGLSSACKVVPYVKLTYPNTTSLSFNVGDIVFIKWTPDPTNFGTVDLRYDTNSGKGANGTPGDADDYTGFIADGINSNNIPAGETEIGHKWTIPDVAGIVGNKVRIKVYQTGKATEVFSEGSYDFAIKGTITITGEANGGATWKAGENKAITWNALGDLGTVNILYAIDGINYVNTVQTGVACVSGGNSYLWQPIPNNVIPDDIRTNVKFKITTPDGSIFNVSANPLTIKAQLVLSQPNGANTLYVDDPDDGTDSYNIQWTTYGEVPQVKLTYDTNSGLGDDGIPTNGDEYTKTIAGGLAISNVNAYSWAVPNAIGNKVRVKVMSAAFPNDVSVTSASDFTILGKIKITAPSAATINANAWLVNGAGGLAKNYLIEWKNFGDMGTVNIYYSDNGGTNYLLVNTASGVNGPQSYTWQVPATWGGRNTIGTDNKIKITDADDETNVFKESDNFEIKGQIALNAPSNGLIFYIGGAPINITWDYAGTLGNIDIFFSSNGGAGWGTAVATVDAGYTQPYALAVPDQPTTQGKIKLEQVSDRTYVTSATSDPGFAIKGSVILLYPKNEPTLKANVDTDLTITWSLTGNIAFVAIDYDKYSGNGADAIGGNADDYLGAVVASTNAATGAYPWHIPADSSAVSDNVRIRIRDANDGTVKDSSIVDFKIKPTITIGSPLGGEGWIVNELKSISWTSKGFAAGQQIKIQYSEDGGNTWPVGVPYEITEIAASALNFPWTIPDSNLSNKCVIRLSKVGDAETKIESNWFTIKGKLDITQPDGSVNLSINTPYTIKWNKTGNVSNVALYYSIDVPHANWDIITGAESLPAGQGPTGFSWTVYDNPSSTVKIKAVPTGANDPTDANESANNNAIIGSIFIQNPDPDTGATLIVDSSYTISWTKFGSIALFDVFYSYDNKQNWTQIGNDIAALNLPWTVLDNLSDQVHFRVVDAGNPNVVAETTGASIIKGSLVIDEPHLSEQLEVSGGTPNKNISWTKHGSLGTLLIEGSTNGFADENQNFAIVSGWSSANPYPWAVNDRISQTVKIRITTSDLAVPLKLISTSANFIIKGKLDITTPGSAWFVNDSNKSIQWNATGTVGNVKLEYYDGIAWQEIIASTPTGAAGTGAGSYTWPTVGDGKTAGCQLRVTDIDDATGTVKATSNAFALYPRITVNEPLLDTNVQVTSNNADLIKWALNNSTKVALVNIYYDTNGGAGGYPTKINGPAVDATLLKYSWNNVPVTTSNNVKIKVQDVDDATSAYFGESPVFKIIGKVTMSQPDGTAWTILKTGVYNIVGSAQGVANVSAYYSTSNGGAGTYTFIGSAAIVGGNYTIAWNTPDAVSDTVKVKVIKTGENVDTTPESAASPTFSLYEEFSNIQPSNGATLTANDATSITWDKLGASLANVKLYVSSDNGGGYTFISQVLNTGSASWNVPTDVRSTLCKIKVENALNAGNFAVSAGVFVIKNRVTITNPTVGTPPWSVGTMYTLQWSYEGPNLINNNPLTPVKVKIEYSPTGLLVDYAVIPGAANVDIGATGTGSWDWTIADLTTLCNATGKIRVTDTGIATATGTSGGGLTIRGNVVPNEIVGSPLKVGDPYNLSWTRSGEVTQVNLYYSINSAAGPWTKINTAGPWDATQQYAWTVADAISNTVRIKVEDANNTSVNNITTADFAIIGKIQITKPTVGELDWVVGDPVLVKWIPTGTYTSVKIEGSRNAFLDELQVFTIATVAAGVTGVEQTHNFNAPDQISNNVKIRVSDADASRSALVKDICQNSFIIKGKLTITTPGSTWYVSDANKVIQWNATGTVGNVKLEYYDGAIWQEIIASTPTGAGGTGAGSYTWPTVGDGKTASCQLRVTDTDDPTGTVKATSNVFALYPKITVSEPLLNSNVQVTSNNPDLIKWSLNGSVKVTQVDIYYDTNGGADGYPNKINTLPVDATLLKYSWDNVPVTTSNNVKIKVQDVDDAVTKLYFGESPVFKIIGKVTMSQPDGTAWTILKTGVYNIVGSAQGVANVSAYYSTSNGGAGTYTFIGSAAIVGGNYTIAWNTPDAVSDTVKVKVIKTGENVDTTPESAASPTFSLYEEFSNIQPSNGATLTANDATSITWDKLGASLANVKLYVSSDNGGGYTFIKETSNTGTSSWNVPIDVRSTLCKIKVESSLNANNAAASSGVFLIKNRVVVTNPTVGTLPWSVGSTYPIQWTYEGPNLINNNPLTPVKVKIEYSPTGLLGDYAIIPGAANVDIGAAGTGSWNWTIADATTLTTTGKIRVTDTGIPTATGASGGNLTIRGNVVPNEIVGSPLKVGDPYNLTWTRFGEITQVNIYYSINSVAGPWTKINTAGPWDATQAYAWTVADAISNTIRIKVEDANNTTVNNVTTADFAIIGKIQITKPTIGEPDWVVGDPVLVKWIPTGTYTSVKIEGSRNAFADESQVFLIATVAAGATAVEQTHNFSASDQISNNVKIRVSDADATRSALVKDICQNSFIIKGNVTITTPGSMWYVGDANKSIQWNATGTIGNVKLEYFDGSVWQQIIASTPTGAGGSGAGTYTWPTVGDGKTASCQLRVTDTDDPTGTVKATSNVFALYPKITVSEPLLNTNVQVTSNNQDLIKWSLNGSAKVTQVDIYYDTNGGADGYPNKINTIPVDATVLKYSWDNVPITTSNNVKIKVQDVDDAVTKVYFGESPVFKIIGKVTMSQPDGTSWLILKNGVYNIVGSAQGVANVSAYYSTANGGAGTYTFIGSAAIVGGNYTIAWNTPDAVSDTVKVKVIKTGENVDTTPESAASPAFSLYEEFSNIQPSNGATFTANDATSITWDKLGASLANVKLYVSADNGTSYTFIKETSNTGTSSWDVPIDVRSTLCKIKVESSLNANNFAVSGGIFLIKNRIAVTNPTIGNPPWSVGSTYPIQWTYEGPNLINNNPLTPVKVKIEYSPTGLLGDYAIIPGAANVDIGAAGTGSWNWTIADATTLTTTGKIRVTDTGIPTATGASGGNLTIRGNVVPNEIVGSPLKVGDPYNLTWTRFGEITQVNIYYSINSVAGPWTKINTAGPWDATQAYAWTVADAITSTLRIKVEDANNPSVFSITSADAKIKGVIDLTYPNGNEIFEVNDPITISWNNTGTLGNVKLEYSTNGFANESETVLIVGSTPAGVSGGAGTFAWSAPVTVIDDSIKARVTTLHADAELVATDTSFGNFKIKGKLRVISPNASSEVWTVGDTPTMQWQRSGPIQNLIIDYSINGGGTWNTITNNADASLGTYSLWQVPDNAVTLQGLIRITDALDPSVTDVSDNLFTIRGALTVDAPGQNEPLSVYSTYPVKWTRKGNFATVDIMFSVNDGAYEFVRDINGNPADNYDASKGAVGFPWYVPDRLSSNVKIKVIDTDDPSNVFAISSQFMIIGQVAFDTNSIPQAGDKWGIGQTHTIRWSIQGSIDTVRLSYSTDGVNYNQIQDSPGGSGTDGILWTIPNIDGIVSTNVTLKIYHLSQPSLVKAVSPVFSVVPSFTVTAPFLDAEVKASQTYLITWNRLGFNPNVKLYYSTDNFSAPGIPIPDTEGTGDGQYLIKNDGSFLWQVPDVISNNLQVRVAYSDDVTVYDDSDIFKIVPGFTVVLPNTSSDEWSVHQNHTITWTCSSANAPKARIFYSTDGGASYPYEITQGPNYADNTGAAGAVRSYVWNVDDRITTQFKIKITDLDASTTTAFDESDFNAKIKAWFNVTQPNGDAGGNQVFYVDQSDAATDIKWQWEGSVTNVKLEYCKDDNWAGAVVIVASTPNDGLYNFTAEGWKIPDYISDTVKVRVSDVDAGHPGSSDVSDNYFKIKGQFTVIVPNGSGDAWDISSTQQIRWSTKGTIPQVDVIAYSTDPNDQWFRDGVGAVYTLANPLVVRSSYANNPHTMETTYDWLIPDKASNKVKIRVISVADTAVYDDSDAEFIIKGSFSVTAPASGNRWTVGSSQQITWNRTGSSITEAKITYSVNDGASWNPVIENEGTSNDGIVTNDGNFTWSVPDQITATPIARIKIEDPGNSSVFNISAAFKIIGAFVINAPLGSERWVTNEVHAMTWTTSGTIDKVNLVYSKDNFTADINTIVAGRINATGNNTYNWTIPDDRSTNVKVRVVDFNDNTVYTDSPVFTIDYYNITWDVRDFLTNLPIGGGLTVNDTSGWNASGLSSETAIVHPTPYGSWSASWTHPDYGDKSKTYAADSDQTFEVYLESKIVHVWEAKTEYVYDNATDKLTFSSTLIRDGSVVTGAKNGKIEIFDPNNPGTVLKTLTNPTADSAGFFRMEWNSTGLDGTKVYNARTILENVLGGVFRTPFIINLAPTTALYNMRTKVDSVLDKPLSQVNTELQATLATQTATIETKMNEQSNIITTKTNEMKSAVEATLASFETRSNDAITKLQSGADKAVAAGEQVASAASELEATAKKYSWNASVSPNPALVGDLITLSCQGQPGMLPVLNVYNADNKTIIRDQSFKETTPGLYVYEFKADGRFPPGKAYTYIVNEPVTGGLVSGSGIVESMSLTTIAGLASAAPAAENAAKKALEAIKEVEAVLVSGENINIALTLKNLQESVKAIPEAIAKEGPSSRLAQQVNEISDRLKVLSGEEGYDLSTLLEDALSQSPTMKDMRSKTDAINSVIEILMQLFENKFGGVDTPVVSTSLQPGSVKFRIAAVNPSKLRTQKIQVKNYLPEEVRPKDILDLGGLELEYDSEKSIYYVYRTDIELNPSEVRVFEVHVEDIWIMPQDKLSELKNRTEAILAKLEKTDYYAKAKEIADTIYSRLDEIAKSQVDDSVSRQQHIGVYRQNLVTVQQVKEDIARLEKLLATAGGPVSPDMLTRSRIKADEPSKSMTWIVIFVIIIFVGLLAGVLLFTWLRQARLTKNELLAAKRSAFPESAPQQKAPGQGL
jgi:hypothetical protein